jgi:MFS family permease
MIQHTFGVNESLVSWVFNIEVLFLMLTTPITAKLSDIFGRRKIYAIFTSIFLIGTLIVTLSRSFEVLLIGRAVQGVGATISVLAITIIGDHFSENKGKFLGIFGFVIALVYALGPIISGYLVNFGWQWIFAINIPIAILVLILSFNLLPKTQRVNNIGLDLKGIILFGIVVATFTGFISGIGNNASVYILMWLMGVCLICLILFCYVEKLSQFPILPIHLLKKRNTLITGFITITSYLAGAGTYFLSTFAVMAFGFSYSQGAYILIPFTLGSLFSTIIIGKLLDKVGARPIMITGGVLSAAGMLLLGFSVNIYTYILSIVLIGIGNAAIAGNALYFIFLEETKGEDRASGQAMLNVLLNSGSLIGGAVLGMAIGKGSIEQFKLVYMCLAGVYVVLILLALGIKPEEKQNSC